MSKKSRFRTPFNSQNVKGCQRLLKSVRQDCYHIFSSLSGKLSRKMCLVETCEILGLRVNTFTAKDKHSLRNMENKKFFKSNLDFRKAPRNPEIVFCFLDSCI